jgi:hypothetical protein
MNIDEYWLDDDAMERTSRQTPSTDFGRELMRKWPARYQEVLSSDTYRGCAIVLLALYNAFETWPNDIATIERVVDDVDRSLKTSRMMNVMTQDALGGASLTIANAWEGAHSGVLPWQAVASFESEAIFAASKRDHAV